MVDWVTDKGICLASLPRFETIYIQIMIHVCNLNEYRNFSKDNYSRAKLASQRHWRPHSGLAQKHLHTSEIFE